MIRIHLDAKDEDVKLIDTAREKVHRNRTNFVTFASIEMAKQILEQNEN